MAFHGLREYTGNEALNLRNGMAGFERIDDTAVHEGDFVCFYVESAATADAGCEVETGDAPESGDTFGEGDVIYAPFTALQFSEGTVYAYYR